MSKTVITFGRMNPPTIGHQKVVDKVKAEAKKQGAMPHVYLSHSQDAKKNPLDYNTKIGIARKAFGPSVTKSEARTIIEVVQELERMGHKEVTLIVGSDRVAEFRKLLNRYNGKDFTFDKITVKSAGQRDPDAEGASGMSATKMRTAAQTGDFNSFKKGVPSALKDADAKKMYDKIRSVMEEMEAPEIDDDIEITEVELDAFIEMTDLESLDEFDDIDEEFEEYLEYLDEVRKPLSVSQRMAIGRRMKRLAPRMARMRKIKMKKLADPARLEKRARKAAIKILRKKFAGKQGENYASLNPGAKMSVDRIIQKKMALVGKISKRLMPKIRKKELERLKRVRSSTNEMVEQAPNTADAMKRYKAGKAGFTDKAHLKAKGLIPRADGTKKKSPKYEEVLWEDEDESTNTKMMSMIRQAFRNPQERLLVIRALKGGEKSLTNPKLRPFLLKLLNRLLDVTREDPAMLAKMRDKLRRMGQEDEKINEREDPDIGDRKGMQPAKYHSGLAKSTKKKRDAQFKKQSKMDDDNPAAYKPAPGDKRSKTKPSQYTKRYKAMYGEDINTIFEELFLKEETLSEKQIEGLKKKSEKSGIPYGILKQVYNRGMAAWRTGHRPGTTPQQWAFARVNSFLTGGKTRTTADKDLWAKASAARKSKKEEVELEEKLKFEGKFKVGDVIRAYDFKPMKGRREVYIQGKIVKAGTMNQGAKVYEIKISNDSGKTSGGRVGDIGYVPMQVSMMEYPGRIVKVSDMKEEVNEIARSMTPMRDRFGSGKKKLSLKDFKRGMFVITKKGEVGKIVANEPRADQVVVKMNKTKKEVEMDWKKLGLYTEPRLKGLVQAEAYSFPRPRPGLKDFKKGTTKTKTKTKEALDKQDEPKVKEIIKKLKGASKAHAGQAKDLEKAVKEMKMYNINFGVIGDVSVRASSQSAAIKHAKKQMLKKNPKFKKDLEKFKVTVIKESAVDATKARIDREKESDKRKHDRMMDTARTRDTQAKNRSEAEHSHEIEVDGYQTKNFHMCGSAQKVMPKLAGKEGAKALTQMQDMFYGLEKEIMKSGSASDEQKAKARDMYNKIMAKAKKHGLDGDIAGYMKMHIDSIEKGKPKLGFGQTNLKESIDEKFESLFLEEPRVPRKAGQPAGSDKHSDLYTDENPKGTIHGLKFATVEDAEKSVKKIESSGRKHAHKIQAAIAMEQRARVAGKKGAADVYRKYINKMKKKTKERQQDEGLWDNIRKKRERIKRGSGERMRKPGEKGAPTADQMRQAKEEYGAGEFGTKEVLQNYQKDTPGQDCSCFDHELTEAEYKGRKVTLNDPFRSNDGKKKFYVYVKNEKGNIIKLGFGDPNMEIKRDDPARRKSFRARHNCDNPGPKYKARYWSCFQWRAGSKVDN